MFTFAVADVNELKASKICLKALMLLQVVQDILPMKARSEVDRLLTELQDAQFKLEFEPTTTIEYVQSLTLLDEIHERVSLSYCHCQ